MSGNQALNITNSLHPQFAGFFPCDSLLSFDNCQNKVIISKSEITVDVLQCRLVVNECDANGNTALQLACDKGHSQVVHLLCAAGKLTFIYLLILFK